jgi:Ca2+-binding EF-hand superfamily protein
MFELQQALTNANWTHFNAETCRLMIGLFDRDQSGQIDANEFGALWQYITQWRAVFDQYDKDKSGSIDVNELLNAYTQMGYRLSAQFAQMIIYRYDPLNKQRLTLDNFIQSCVLLKTVTDTFKQKDTQMQGRISVAYEEFLMMVLLNKPA